MGNLLSAPTDFFLNFSDLKWIFKSALANPSAVVTNTSSPVYFQLVVLGVIHVYTYVNGCLSDWSGVDRCWSVTPMLYANSFWIYKYMNTGTLDTRLLTMSSLVTLWGCRLTYNFAIKGTVSSNCTYFGIFRFIATVHILFEYQVAIGLEMRIIAGNMSEREYYRKTECFGNCFIFSL